mgnify:CR=1 FL=1
MILYGQFNSLVYYTCICKKTSIIKMCWMVVKDALQKHWSPTNNDNSAVRMFFLILDLKKKWGCTENNDFDRGTIKLHVQMSLLKKNLSL